MYIYSRMIPQRQRLVILTHALTLFFYFFCSTSSGTPRSIILCRRKFAIVPFTHSAHSSSSRLVVSLRCCIFLERPFSIAASGRGILQRSDAQTITLRVCVTHPYRKLGHSVMNVFQVCHDSKCVINCLTDGPFTNEWREFLHRAFSRRDGRRRHWKVVRRTTPSRHLPRPASSWFRDTSDIDDDESTGGYASVNIRRRTR